MELQEDPCIGDRVETGSGQPGHIFAGLPRSNPLYKISGSDPDWITCDINGIWR